MNNLIYYSISHNPEYVRLLEMSLESVCNTGNYKGDFAFILDIHDVFWRRSLNNLPILQGKNCYLIHNNSGNTLESSSYNKFLIYKFSNIQKYSSILMLDCDILCTQDLTDVLNLPTDNNKLYISTEKEFMGGMYWGNDLFTEEDKKYCINNNLHACNGGSYIFKPQFVHHFQKMYTELTTKRIYNNTVCIEQPFLNYYLFKNNLFDTSFSKYVDNYGYYSNPLEQNKTLVHFAGGPGSFDFKYKKMVDFNDKFVVASI